MTKRIGETKHGVLFAKGHRRVISVFEDLRHQTPLRIIARHDWLGPTVRDGDTVRVYIKTEVME
jgi:hypothetical protein